MNIYKFELSRLKKSILVWGLSVPGFLILYMAFFPAMAASGDAFNDLMMNMDPKFLAAFGIIPELPVGEILDISILQSGYYWYLLLFKLPIMVSIS